MEDRGIKSHLLARRAVKTGQDVKVTRACTIRKAAQGLFQFWRNLENIPSFMQHVVAVEVHPNPAEAWSGQQQVTLEGFAPLMRELKPFIATGGRE